MLNLTRREALAALTLSTLADARGLITDQLQTDVITAGLETAKAAGATYADIRLHRRRDERISVRDDHVDFVSDSEDYGLAVRVLVEGAWGFAAAPSVSVTQAKVLAHRAVALAKANATLLTHRVELAAVKPIKDLWQTPLIKDPFRVPVADKANFLLELCAQLRSVKGVGLANARVSSRLEWKLLGSSDGSVIEQRLTRLGPSFSATAIDQASGEWASRAWDGAPRQAGWEWIDDSRMLLDAERVAADAVEKLAAPSVQPGLKTLVLHPSNLFLTIHESVGHPTELDRALGLEANFAGTSFATIDKLGSVYASPAVTLYADRTTPGGLATCGYDDDGVPTQRWLLVDRGRLSGYQTTREQAGWLGEKTSRGCAYAEDYRSVAFQRMPNVSLAPGDKDLGIKELLEATEDGLYIVGDGSWSIDHQRYNFQFSGQMFYEVKKGRILRTVKDVAYQSNTLEFWKSCDMVGGPRSWELNGVFDDAKGEPTQSNPVSHGCPAARFQKVMVLNTRKVGA